MTEESRSHAHPPETLEGWYSLHDTYLVRGDSDARAGAEAEMAAAISSLNKRAGGKGWSCLVSLVGGPADFLVLHLRDSSEALSLARWSVADVGGSGVERGWSLLGATEAGLYHLTAELARDAHERGGEVGDLKYTRTLGEKVEAEKANDRVRARLYPEFPSAQPYFSFYPMSKRRSPGQNWYTLDLEERSRLMRAHGLTGRKYAGRVQQIITGSIGLAQWEWGVTLFARDPLDIKKLVTDMRFDEVSAEYAEFGEFYVGKVVAPKP